MLASGTLTVRTYVSRAQLPIEGVTVVVTTDHPSGKQELISIQITDSSGRIQPVTIETPPTGESTSPMEAGQEEPFALCTVWAEHPDYVMLRVEGVQIFPGVETIQNLELLPLAEGENGMEQEEIRSDDSSQNL